MIKIKKLTEDTIIPHRSREGDACYDLYTSEDILITGEDYRKAIPTGIAMQLPKNYEAEIRPRSGISLNGLKHNGEIFYIEVIQGTIDSNYIGEINIIVANPHINRIIIPKHTKLAQMKINHVPEFEIIEVDELEVTNRGANGFGSSGI